MAEAKGINYSQVLQTALMEMLGVAEDRITYGRNLR
jgi:hypothetical protein